MLTIYPDGSQAAFVGEHHEVESDTARSYYFFGSRRVAMRADDGVSQEVYWFHTDHLGSTSLLSTITGTLAAGSETRFLPYGEYRVKPEAELTDHGFTGHKQQDAVGLIYMRARYYVPYANRFIQPDDIVPDFSIPQSLNRYSYVLNRPLVFSDLAGRSPFTDWLTQVGQNSPVGRALVVGMGEVVRYVNQQVENVLYPDADTDFGDRLWSSVQVGGASVGFAVVSTEFALGTLTTAAATGGTATVATATGTVATATCADGYCLNAVRAVEKTIQTDWTVLGKYPGHLEAAQRWGAEALNIPTDEWDRLTRADQWAMNVRFLDDAIAQGHSFLLSTPLAEGWAETGTFFKDELVYLLQKGCELVTVNGTDYLIKP